MDLVKSVGRSLVWVLAGLAVLAAGLGIGLGLAQSPSQTGTLTGEIRLMVGGPLGENKTLAPGPGTVTVNEVSTAIRGTPCNLCQERTVATQGVSRGRDIRFALPTGSYDVHARAPLNAFAPCNPVRVSIRSGETLSVTVTCVSTFG